MNGKPFLRSAPPLNPPPLSDNDLLGAIARGEQTPLGLLFDRHASHVTRFLARIHNSNKSDLEDLLQLTFMQVQHAAHTFRGESTVCTWLFAIASHVASNFLRKEQRSRRMRAAIEALPQARAISPAEHAEHRQMVDRLGLALEELSHEMREAFVMCDVEEIPGVEVARVLGLRPGTLWRRLHDARRKLRAALET